MKSNSIVLAALAFIAGSVIAAPANIESRDIPLLGGHSGLLQGVGETLDSVEKLIPGLGQ
ncbi:hypothetical protein J3458_000398 [Metarhizium acridum]|uniref:uncharacterized protein n=1 Tax=Metarhizium acridum TaxID=92637 RepID=UPI001C6B87AB|nr:hypothetical protein J3458_000398 [Metarhizium acridum]